MEILVLIAAIGFASYSFLKANTKRGAETVRAHVYLSGIEDGASVAEANHVASYDVASGPAEVIHTAILHMQAEYDGKQGAMISDAYQKGMLPKLPSWYRSFVLKV